MSLEGLYTYWLEHPSLWFFSNEAEDVYITRTYGNLLRQYARVSPHELLQGDPPEDHARRLVVSYVILFDQVVRHVARVDPESVRIHRAWYAQLAILGVDVLQEDDPMLQRICIPACLFLMVPLRNTNSYATVEQSITLMLDRWNHASPSEKRDYGGLVRRFLCASYIQRGRMLHPMTPLGHMHPLDTFQAILDPTRPWCPLYRVPSLLEKIRTSALWQKVHPLLPSHAWNQAPYVVSLSGDVSSMVLFMLCLAQGVPFCAVHVHYPQDPEANAKEALAETWSTGWGIKCYTRRFWDVPREDKVLYREAIRTLRRELYQRFSSTVVLPDSRHSETSFSTWRQLQVHRPFALCSYEEILTFATEFHLPALRPRTIREPRVPSSFPACEQHTSLLQQWILPTIRTHFVSYLGDSIPRTIELTLHPSMNTLTEEVWRLLFREWTAWLGCPAVSRKSIRHWISKVVLWQKTPKKKKSVSQKVVIHSQCVAWYARGSPIRIQQTAPCTRSFR